MPKTDNELNYLAQKYGWKKEPLTRARINRMTADESDWQSRFNAEEFNRAFEAPRVEAENKRKAEVSKASRIHAEQYTEEEFSAGAEEVRRFLVAFPQIIRSYQPNLEAITARMRESNRLYSVGNLRRCFEELVMEGALLLSPAAIGAGPEKELGGYKLKTYRNLNLLLEPQKTPEQLAQLQDYKLSDSEYREKYKKDFREPYISPQQREDWNKAFAFFFQSRPDIANNKANLDLLWGHIKASGLQVNPQGLAAAALALKDRLAVNESAVQTGQAIRYTNLGGSEPGFPPASDKYSFQSKIDSMSSSDYLRRINTDSQFREAVDALER